MRSISILLATLLLFASNSYAYESPKVMPQETPKRVLFVGNSFSFYNNGLHNQFSSLVKSAQQWLPGQSRVRLKSISGGKLAEHISGLPALFDNSAQRQWDLIVLQDYSNGPISKKYRNAFLKASQWIADYAGKQGTKTALFMTWAYKGETAMTEALADAYTKQGNKLNALVVPVGLAFDLVTREHPAIDLYISDVEGFSQDGKTQYKQTLKHPSVAGSYLAACVFYSTLFQRSPESLPYVAGLANEQALTLQKAAWQSYQNYFSE